ncbi:MAG TPA: TetR/AcrR family transcriptional regulator [Flavobacterium sp.]|jgi:AcrR family transcriptional regulator
MTSSQEIWIKEGYEIFALEGAKSLKIESLSKKAGISKSSFYHHFSDMEVFVVFLLQYHIKQAHVIAEKERQAKNVEPELINILIAHKTDLLFNRQLRIHCDHKDYSSTLIQSNTVVGNAFVMVWIKDLNLQLNQKQLEGIFELAMENFYLQIHLENLNYTWLVNYFTNLKKIAARFV